MNFGLSTYFLVKKNIREVVKYIVSSGFKTVEISCEIPHFLQMNKGFFSYLKSLRGEGIEFSLHAPFLEINLGSYFEDVRRYSKSRILKSLDIAEKIGCNPVVVHPCYTFVKDKSKAIEEKTMDNFITDLREVVRVANNKGLEIALENVHMPFFFFYKIEDFKNLQKIIPELGIAFDLGHAYIAKCSEGNKNPEESIIEDIRLAGMENISHIHLHNNSGIRDDHQFLEGNMDVEKITDFIEKNGYTRKIIIESPDPETYGMDAVLKKISALNGILEM